METGGFPKPASQSLVMKSRLNERSCLKEKKKTNKESNNKDSIVNFWFLYAYSPKCKHMSIYLNPHTTSKVR